MILDQLFALIQVGARDVGLNPFFTTIGGRGISGGLFRMQRMNLYPVAFPKAMTIARSSSGPEYTKFFLCRLRFEKYPWASSDVEVPNP